MENKLMRCLLTLSVTVLIAVLLLGLLPVHGESKIYDSVVRLHVLANSDSTEDQELKFKVRDYVLMETSKIVDGAETREEAEAVLRENLDRIEAVAAEVVADGGYDYPVTVELGLEEYPTRDYESICFPSGTYTSLRVCIGEAEGQNWWCVLFPNLCLAAASKSDSKQAAEDAFISAGLTPEQYKIITETEDVKYTVRFKFLEVFEKLFGRK